MKLMNWLRSEGHCRADGPGWPDALATLLIAALHVAYFTLCLRRGHIDPGVDGEVYRQLARDYLASESFLGEKCRIVFWTPWYVIIALVGATQSGVFLLQLSFFILTLVAIAGAAQQLGLSLFWRLLAITAYGLYWPTFDYVVFYQYENFLAWAVVTTVWLLGREREVLRTRWQRWLVAGAVVGLGVFAHSRVAGVALLGGVILVALSFRSRRPHVKLHAAFWGPVILPTLLWGIRNRLLFGQWILSSTSFGYNFYVGFNPVATGSFMPQPPYPPLDRAAEMALEFIRSHPGRAAELVVWKLVRFWEISRPDQFGPWWLLWQEWILMPLGLVAFMMMLGRVGRSLLRERWPLFPTSAEATLFNLSFVMVYFLAFTAVFYVFTPRFRLPTMPLIVLAGVWCLHEGWRETCKKRGKAPQSELTC